MSKKESCCLQFFDGVFSGENLWCLDKHTHELFCIDTKTMDIIQRIDIASFTDNEPRKLFVKDKWLYITFLYGAKILRIDMQNFKHECICGSDNENVKMMNAVMYKCRIYLFPRNILGYVYIYDMLTNETSKAEIPKGNSEVYIINSDSQGALIYGVVPGTNKILTINLDSLLWSVHILDIDVELVDVISGNEELFLLGKDRLIRCSYDYEICEEVVWEESIGACSRIIDAKEEFIIVPYGKNTLYRTKKYDINMIQIEMKGDTWTLTEPGSSFFGYKFFREKMFLFPWSGNILVEWKLGQTYATGREINVDKSRIDTGKSSLITYENRSMFGSLEYLLQGIRNPKTQYEDVIEERAIGEIVYDNVNEHKN